MATTRGLLFDMVERELQQQLPVELARPPQTAWNVSADDGETFHVVRLTVERVNDVRYFGTIGSLPYGECSRAAVCVREIQGAECHHGPVGTPPTSGGSRCSTCSERIGTGRSQGRAF